MGSRKSIVVVGAGGFAREVRWLIDDINRDSAQYEFGGYVVSDQSQLGERDDIAHVIGEVSDLQSGALDVDALALGIGNPTVRASIGSEILGSNPEFDWPTLIHPSVKGDLQSWSVGRGVLLCAGVVGTVNVTVSDFALVNLSCTIGHEAKIGIGSVLYPLVSVSGGVSIGDRVLIGTGANILQYVSVGDDSAVGAGAVVVKDVEPGTTVVGIPARTIGNP
jgi:sugar O-acyltransferase (sialic acid O-acetyltransferase NeuD family)